MKFADKWFKNEIQFRDNIKFGDKGNDIRKLQEWLCIQGQRIVIDGDYGHATHQALINFSSLSGIRFKSIGFDFLRILLDPLVDVLIGSNRAKKSRQLSTDLVYFANLHLASHPIEVGGQNMGPWVRIYAKGNQGPAWPWCAGFVSFCLHQAFELRGEKPFLAYTMSCDQLALEGQREHRFVAGDSGRSGSLVKPGDIFLRKRHSGDWDHAGIVIQIYENSFLTVEGNTNDDGTREGYEVCSRIRAFGEKIDFVSI